MRRLTTFLTFLFVGPMVGGISFIGATIIAAGPARTGAADVGLLDSALGLVVAAGVFGLLYGLAPAALTGLVGAFAVDRMPARRFLAASGAAGALVSLVWASWLLRGAPVEPALRLVWMFAGAIAAIASAALAIRLHPRAAL